MKLHISADIEGVAGVCSFDQMGPGNFEWESARRWMTAEVNAAIEGAFEAGVTEVLVADSHGNALNLHPDTLDTRARLVRGFPRPLLQMQGIEEPDVALSALIGFHTSMGNPQGVIAHTYFGGFHRVVLNGVEQSEGSLNAALAAEYGVPVVFMSGDDRATAELKEVMPWLHTVTTKTANAYTSTTSLSPSASCDAIRTGMRNAVANCDQASLHWISGPYELDIEFKRRQQAEWLSLWPGVELLDAHTARLRPKDLKQAMKMITFCIFGLARPQ